jgi:protein-S-isoprenylcysteine O-methyltransferase Ste14
LRLFLSKLEASSTLSLHIAFAFLYRINVEERALVQALGDHYRAYVKRAKRLIPLVY